MSRCRSFVVVLAMLSGCHQDSDDVYPGFAPGALLVSTLTPVAGQRVAYSLAGDGMVLTKFYQGDTQVSLVIGRAAPAFVVGGHPGPVFGSFIAQNSEPVTAVSYGGKGESQTLSAEAGVPCVPDGLWLGDLGVYKRADAACGLAVEQPISAQWHVRGGASVLNSAETDLPGYLNGCTADFYIAGQNPVYQAKLDINGDSGQAVLAYYELQTTDAGEIRECLSQWTGTLSRAPEAQ